VSPYLLLSLTAFFWSLNWVIGRAIVGHVTPFALTYIRWIVALSLMLPFAWPAIRAHKDVIRRDWKMIVWLGFWGTGLHNVFAYAGLQYTTATNGVILNSSVPIMIIVLGWLIYRDTITRQELLARGVAPHDAQVEAGASGGTGGGTGADGGPSRGGRGGAPTETATAETAEGEAEAAKTEEAEGEVAAAGAGTEPIAAESDVPAPYTLAGIGEKTVRKLVEGGFATLESLGGATAEQLSAIPGIGDKTAEKILAAARGDAPAPDESSADL